MVKVFNRVQQTDAKKPENEVLRKGMAEANSATVGKQKRKRQILHIWLQGGRVATEATSDRINEIGFSKEIATDLKWLTMKELLDKHGKEEAETMIADNSFIVRRNPQNTKFYQFLSRTDNTLMKFKKATMLKAITAVNKTCVVCLLCFRRPFLPPLAGGLLNLLCQEA